MFSHISGVKKYDVFTHKWSEEIRCKSLCQGLDFDMAPPGLEIVTS